MKMSCVFPASEPPPGLWPPHSFAGCHPWGRPGKVRAQPPSSPATAVNPQARPSLSLNLKYITENILEGA